jgi:hypothetical protein
LKNLKREVETSQARLPIDADSGNSLDADAGEMLAVTSSFWE